MIIGLAIEINEYLEKTCNVIIEALEGQTVVDCAGKKYELSCRITYDPYLEVFRCGEYILVFDCVNDECFANVVKDNKIVGVQVPVESLDLFVMLGSAP